MTQQELIDHNVRLMLGDLMVQIAMLRARITELEAVAPQPEQVIPKPNGHVESRTN